jgi:hypothetical protein
MAEAKRKRVKYVGPARRVEVLLPDGSSAYCERNKSVSVPAAVAKNLTGQADWVSGESKKTASSEKVSDETPAAEAESSGAVSDDQVEENEPKGSK